MKKKTSIYFLVPLACVLAFGGYYWTFLKAHNAKETLRIKKIEKDKQDKILKDKQDTDLAFERALAARAVKDAAKKAKDEQIAAEKDAKLKRKEARSVAESDAEHLIRTIDDKRNALADITKEVGALEAQKKALAEEAVIIQKTVVQAKENTAAAQADVMLYQKAKLAREAAERERIAAEKAAAQKK